MGTQPFLPSRAYRRVPAQAAARRGDPDRISDILRSTGRGNYGLYSDNESVRRRRDHRRDGLRVLVLGDGYPARLPRLRRRRSIPPCAPGRAYLEIRVADAYRRNTGRNLSRPRCRPKSSGRRIARGVADRIEAVLWFSDLRNYTRISDSADPEQIIPLLNEYADAILSAIHGHEGDVLKLIGDGTLAIFTAADRASACHAALTAALEARRAVALVNERRIAADLPTTDMYLGLHVGEVFYGNIGSEERLDFTVVGPAVNEVSRIASMCRSLDQPVLVSSAFAAAIGEPKKTPGLGRALRAPRSRTSPEPVYGGSRGGRRRSVASEAQMTSQAVESFWIISQDFLR